MSMHDLLSRVRPTDPAAAAHRAAGHWRDGSFTEDLLRAARETPHRVAMVGHRVREGRDVTVTYHRLADRVERIAAGLSALGLRRRDVLAIQLPSRWQTAALALACDRIGVVAALVPQSTGPRELERVLAGTRARACVLVHEWEGATPATSVAAAAAAGRLPGLGHRIVLGPAEATGALSFTTHLLHSAAPAPPPTPLDPDEPSVIVFTSGTAGAPTAVLHSPNTLYAAIKAAPRRENGSAASRTTPGGISHSVGLCNLALAPLVHRAPAHFADLWDPGAYLDMLARNGTQVLLAVPWALAQLVTEQHRSPRPLGTLRTVVSVGTPLPRPLVPRIRATLCERLVNEWGMTELGGGTATAHDDPDDWPALSIGRAMPGVELRLEPSGDGTSHLFVRSPATCLATADRDTGRLRWSSASTDGWYDTGDLVDDDGRGGLRFRGRAADRVKGSDSQLIPVQDVEDELRTHPRVQDAALVGYPDPEHSELPCAVVVPQTGTTPPTLAELRAHLTTRGMTEWYQPSRLELRAELPRTHLGKVDKRALRTNAAKPPTNT
ncbi:AMP-binding protein [Streptomyces sp. MAR4 CNX-425]|uniref:AMP-binding protein n=1 Tax=Streptomyces sp. MAR4 CNX-425 TaxID=3406343 RepID=UPI003B5059A0